MCDAKNKTRTQEKNPKKKERPPIICITNRRLCAVPFMDQIKRIAEAGFPRIILREKDLTEYAYKKMAEEFLKVCKACETEGTLHTYEKCAADVGAESLHLSMDDLRRRTREHTANVQWQLGVSVHSATEAEEAELLGADYVTAGHIFATDCKRGIPGKGLSYLEEVVRSVKIPVYAIGGISADNLGAVRDTGAAGACIMGRLMKTEHPDILAENLLRAWKGERILNEVIDIC